jgi:16S rRNA processing protein RimM
LKLLIEPLITVARAVKTRGLKGEVVADLLTDFPKRFEDVSKLFAVSPCGERSTVELESHWFHKDRIILKLKGYDSVEAATSLVGCEFAVPESEAIALAEDEFYDWELEGCSVATVAGEHLGTVKRVVRTGGVDMIEVECEGQLRLIPLVQSIVIEIDKDRKSIVIDPPKGLLEL